MKSIAEFIDEIELPGTPSIVAWNVLLANAGYYPVTVNKSAHWREVMNWCELNIGAEHYTWTGEVIWLETSEDATLCALVWR